MITKGIWKDLGFKLEWKTGYGFYYDDEYVVWILIGTIIFTPFAIALDILFLPIELFYMLCEKIVYKKRWGSDKE